MEIFRLGSTIRPMDRKPFPSETQERFIIRFPDGMRDRIAVAAKANSRSMNSEIVARLQVSLAMEEPSPEQTDEALRAVQIPMSDSVLRRLAFFIAEEAGIRPSTAELADPKKA